jgi:hypothetical protein
MLRRIITNVILALVVIEAKINPTKMSQGGAKFLWRRKTTTMLGQNTLRYLSLA